MKKGGGNRQEWNINETVLLQDCRGETKKKGRSSKKKKKKKKGKKKRKWWGSVPFCCIPSQGGGKKDKKDRPLALMGVIRKGGGKKDYNATIHTTRGGKKKGKHGHSWAKDPTGERK